MVILLSDSDDSLLSSDNWKFKAVDMDSSLCLSCFIPSKNWTFFDWVHTRLTWSSSSLFSTQHHHQRDLSIYLTIMPLLPLHT